MTMIIRATIALLAVSIAGCGGGGGGDGEVLAGKQAVYPVGGTLTFTNTTAGQPTPTVTLVNLVNNRSLSLTNTGSFTFESLPTGAGYQLAVQPQPAGFACSVSNGNNQVNGAAVSNVAVTCRAGDFSVGGTVTGLGTGNPGLVVGNNGNTLNISADGPFSFTVSNGAAYNVHIATAHGHYQCVLRNPSGTQVSAVTGTVNAAHVEGISIVCATAVNVSVFGLGANNPGLSLVNSYGTDGSNATRTDESLTVQGDGAVSFATRLPFGRAYTVNVSGTGHPDYNCAVANGNGTTGAAVVTIAVNCTAPAALTLVGSTPGDGATNVALRGLPQITFAAGIQSTTAHSGSVYLSNAFGSEATSLDILGPTVVLNPAQRLIPSTAYVLTVTSALRGVQKQRLPSPLTLSFTTGSGWSAAQSVGTNVLGANFQNYRENDTPQIAFLAGGDALAAWSVPSFTRQCEPPPDQNFCWYDESGMTVYFSRLTAGSQTWSAPQPMTPAVSAAAGFRIASDGVGNALFVLRNGSTLTERRYSTGLWTGAINVDTGGRAVTDISELVTDGNGNAHLIVLANDGVAASVYAHRYTFSTGIWNTPTPLESNATPAAYPALAAAGGRAIASWTHIDTYPATTLNVSRFSGTAWDATPTVIASSDAATNYLFDSRLAFDIGGYATVIWTQGAGNLTYDLYAKRFIVGTGWEASQSTLDTFSNYIGNMSVAYATNGNAYASWTQYDGSATNLYVSKQINGVWSMLPAPEAAAGAIYDAKLIVDWSDNAIVAWTQAANGSTHLFANQYTARANSWSSPHQVETAVGTTSFPALALNPATNNALAVWLKGAAVSSARFGD